LNKTFRKTRSKLLSEHRNSKSLILGLQQTRYAKLVILSLGIKFVNERYRRGAMAELSFYQTVTDKIYVFIPNIKQSKTKIMKFWRGAQSWQVWREEN
jgi:hypothetical protein